MRDEIVGTDFAFAIDLLDATGFDLHFPPGRAVDMTDPEFRRVSEHRDRSAAKLAAIIARVRRERRPVATAQHHVFATRLCEVLGIKLDAARLKALVQLRAEEHEVAVACAVVRMENLFDVRERTPRAVTSVSKTRTRKKGTLAKRLRTGP